MKNIFLFLFIITILCSCIRSEDANAQSNEEIVNESISMEEVRGSVTKLLGPERDSFTDLQQEAIRKSIIGKTLTAEVKVNNVMQNKEGEYFIETTFNPIDETVHALYIGVVFIIFITEEEAVAINKGDKLQLVGTTDWINPFRGYNYKGISLFATTIGVRNVIPT